MAHLLEPSAWNVAYLAAWFLGSYLYHGLGITLGYHRLLTHKSLKVPKWLMYVIVFGGYTCMMGAPIVWVGVHRLHHQKSDVPGDPHSPRDGFMHSLVGWMFHMYDYQTDDELQKSAGEELMNDPFLRMFGVEHAARQAQLCLGVNIALRLGIWALFGFGAALMSTLAVSIVFISTQFVNSVCHLDTAGYRLHDTRDGSRNVWWVALLSLGEGWHNNHHAVPKSARHGMAWWEFDVTWLTIALFEKIGLAENIIVPPANKMPGYKGPQPVPAPVPVPVPVAVQTPVGAGASASGHAQVSKMHHNEPVASGSGMS